MLLLLLLLLLLLARNEQGLARIAGGIEAAGGNADIRPVDLSDATAVEAVARRMLDQDGAPDILVNNAGSRERVPGIARLLLPVLSKERVARAVVDGVERDGRFVVIPGMLRAVHLLHGLSPGR